MSGVVLIWGGMGLVSLGLSVIALGVLQADFPKPERPTYEREVREFFKAVADSSHIMHTEIEADGTWNIQARALDERGAPFTAVPVGPLLELSRKTNQPVPWNTEADIDAREPSPELKRSSPQWPTPSTL